MMPKPTEHSETTFETAELRRLLSLFLDQQVVVEATGESIRLGNFLCGVYAFFDYDNEPIYVGQTKEKLGVRVQRHLTNQRTDAVAMKVLDPFEVYKIMVWPIQKFQVAAKPGAEATKYLNWLEYTIFQEFLGKSQFKAVLNEKDPMEVPNEGFDVPDSYDGIVVSDAVYELRSHPDTRLARRAETLSLLAKVISERQVQPGLRKTLLTQAMRIVALSEKRLGDFLGNPPDGT